MEKLSVVPSPRVSAFMPFISRESQIHPSKILKGGFPLMSAVPAQSIRATVNARELRILLLGFERIDPKAVKEPMTVIIAETISCKITAVRLDGAMGLVIEAA